MSMIENQLPATEPAATQAPRGAGSAPSAERQQRSSIRSADQAIVLVERRRSRQGDKRAEEMPPGWKWVLGNAPLGELYDRIFADAQLTWSSLVVPEEQQATFGALSAIPASRHGIVSYDGQLQISPASLTTSPDSGEPLYLIFNGHRFPICDLNHAITVHRQNRCDATLVDFPQPRRRTYDERLAIGRDGIVHRVDRSYDNTSARAVPAAVNLEGDWPVIIVLSSVAMQRLLDVSLPHRINQWPAVMLRAGLKLRGSTIPGRSFSLHDREHLYELNEVLLRLRPDWIAEAGGLEDQGQKIWVGKDVRIAASAQLIGPVAVGDGVEIGPDAVIVGPTTLGHHSKIGSNIILKRSVVMPNTTLASGTIKSSLVSHAIVLGGDTPSIQAISSAEGDLQALSVDRPIRLETVLEAGTLPSLSGARYTAFCMTKRLMDLIGAIIFIACTLPFYPLVMLAVFINSPGRIFFGHERQGRGGRNFRCWKFRTMVPNADRFQSNLLGQNEVDGPQFKMKDDPRVFFVGRWLRKLNIDEWPQFFNVLAGQMSLVGPRPSPDRENQMCPAWREARLSVRPGVTGLWQVMRKRDRGETDFQEWIYYDVQYVKKQSIWLDLKILLKTVKVVLSGGSN